MFNCKYCNKSIANKGGLAVHEPYCKLNPQRKHRKVSENACAKKGVAPWNKGKTLEQLVGHDKAVLIKSSVSSKLKGRKWKASISDERNNKRIQKIKETAAIKHTIGGIRQGAGRGKKGWYKGYWCDSSWELAFVIYNLEHGIKFKRNKMYFEYNWQGKIKKYYPDFKDDTNTLFEIKGYFTEQTKAKLQAVPSEIKIKVIGKKEIQPYLNYVVNKYGKDFIYLYE